MHPSSPTNNGRNKPKSNPASSLPSHHWNILHMWEAIHIPVSLELNCSSHPNVCPMRHTLLAGIVPTTSHWMDAFSVHNLIQIDERGNSSSIFCNSILKDFLAFHGNVSPSLFRKKKKEIETIESAALVHAIGRLTHSIYQPYNSCQARIL